MYKTDNTHDKHMINNRHNTDMPSTCIRYGAWGYFGSCQGCKYNYIPEAHDGGCKIRDYIDTCKTEEQDGTDN